MGKVSILATDIGYGHTKYAFNNELRKFPTILKETMEYDSIGEQESVSYKNRTYIVGDAAIHLPQHIQSTSEGFLFNYAPIFLYETMRQLNYPKIDIAVVSLSLLEYKNKKADFEKICSEFTINGKTFKQDVIVLPQGVGIWYTMDTPENALIIDIGYNTIDVLTIDNAKPKAVASFGIRDNGVMTLVANVKNYVEEKVNATIEEGLANKILQKGSFKFERREYDIHNEISKMQQSYTNRILELVLNDTRIKNISKYTDHLIIAGGGAYYIDPEIKAKHNIEIPENPEFANVVGFIKEVKKNYQVEG